ncbi:MAG: beta-galactosidase [Chloroflexi bacterium]|nr:beta-galactosidase [Chloroflexota bacterium]
MKFGVCYYPEHWPEERWPEDARLMRELGLDLVRIAEFAWAKMEPAPGQFDWAWLDRAIGVLADAGLAVVLGTPTATPPAWLTRAHPDVLRVDANGRARDHGARRHYCPNSPTYRQFSRQIVQAMGERYGRDPRIIGWQIDNEFGGGGTARCYCDHCAAAFRDWLRAKYGTLDALNEAWGTIFWSQTYTDWTQITLPGDAVNYKNPGHLLDFYRFSSDAYVGYQQEQLDILRQLAPGRFITHNFMGLYRDLDQFDLARGLDFATWDNYPTGNPDRWRQQLYPPGADWSRSDPVYAYDVGDPLISGLAHALTYGLKDAPFWIMEQQMGHINWGIVNPWVRPGTPRLWVWQAICAGAEAIVHFRWRATLLAQEQYHSGLLRHDGSADVGYFEQLQLAQDKPLLDEIAAAPLTAEVAILFDFADVWALQMLPHRRDFDYLRHIFAFYHALQRLGVPVKIVSRQADLSAYKLVIAPSLHLADEETAVPLHSYVTNGGTLLLGVRSGFKLPDNRVTDQPLPGALRPLAGARVTTWRSLPPDIGAAFQSDIPNLTGPATYWVETLAAETAVSLAAYTDGSGAALTEHGVGNGRVLYLGFYPTPAQATALLTHLAGQLAITRLADLPPGLLAARRGPYTILLNFSDGALTAVVQGEKVVVNGRDVGLLLR